MFKDDEDVGQEGRNDEDETVTCNIGDNQNGSDEEREGGTDNVSLESEDHVCRVDLGDAMRDSDQCVVNLPRNICTVDPENVIDTCTEI